MHEIVDAVEIDKYAITSFNAIHGTNFEPQDICTWDKDIQADLIMHGSPCQDFSVAGKQAGGDIGSGTRSSLMYETVRIVGKLRPKYVIWENVKNVLSAKHKHNFDNYINTLSALGYKNYYKVLNAKDFGIPQNRERVFTISIRNDIDKTFEFPNSFPLELRLKDMLDSEIEEKYYLSEKMVNFFYRNEEEQKQKGNGFRFGVSDGNVVAKSVTTKAGCRMDDNFVKCEQVATIEKEGWFDQMKRVYSADGLSPTIPTCQGGNTEPKIMLGGAYGRNFGSKGKIQDTDVCDTLQAAMGAGGGNVPLTSSSTHRIRKLTPKECWRLMGFTDSEFEKASSVGISNTQLYKQAGNSIVVNVLVEIFRNLFKE